MGKTVVCSNCKFSTEGAVIIRCLSCPQIELCLLCFSTGAEFGNHRRDHPYTVIDIKQFAVLPALSSPPSSFDCSTSTSEWLAKEELALFDAVEQFGFGNWEDIAKHVGTKHPHECVKHYGSIFIQGNIGKCTLSKELICNVTDHSSPGGPLSPSMSTIVPPADLAPHEQKALGYMPLRDDYEREFNNVAESSISSLRHEVEDDELDMEFKAAFVDMYRQNIRDRFKMHKIAKNHGVVTSVFSKTSKSQKQSKKHMTKEQREIRDSMKHFDQFLTSTDKDKYYESLKRQKQLQHHIKDMTRYRRNGLTKLDECTHFDEDEYLRNKRQENRKKMQSPQPKRATPNSKKTQTDNLNSQIQNGSSSVKDDSENNVDTTSGYDLLTDTEKRLINSIGLKPAFYITIKTCILKDYLQRRQGVPVKVRYPIGMEKSHRLKIVNFLRDSGWIGAS